MSLEELTEDLQAEFVDLDDELAVSLDQETKQELAILLAATDPEDPGELLRRAVHMLFQSTVETGKLDFHLRSTYDVTYDEYLSGMTYEEMTGGTYQPDPGTGTGTGNDDRRYQF